MTLDFQSRLEKKLEEIDHNCLYTEKFQNIKKYCINQLPKINALFNNFTDHGINHSLKVSEFL